jgi:uncharacterized YccA/Bax inhibitor family protein
MQSGNPALNKNTFLDAASGALVGHGEQVMTLNGTINRTGLLLVLVVIGAMFSWSQFHGPEAPPRSCRWRSAVPSSAWYLA